MRQAHKLPPLVAVDRSGDGYWRGSGRFERGDRRDRSLTHWRYGQRVDAARVRRLNGMLTASWPRIHPKEHIGKRYRTSCKILEKIALSINSVQGISFITKASIAAELGMHRNTIYKHCKAMEMAGVLIQGHYAAQKEAEYKSYSVFGVPGITGRLPAVLTFRRRHSKRSKVVQINWPIQTIARYGERPLPQATWPFLVTPVNENILKPEIKNVHSTCDHQLYLKQAVQNADQDSRERLKEGSGTGPAVRLVDIGAAKRGQSPRDTPKPALKRLKSVKQDGFEGKAPRFLPSRFDGSLLGVERVRGVMQAYECAFGHLENYQPIVGFPRGWMRARVLSITPDQWAKLVQLVLARPMLCGAAPCDDGRIFALNFWWLMKEAPRLLTQLAPIKPAPDQRDRAAREVQGPLTSAERAELIDNVKASNPQLAEILARWAKDIEWE